MRSMLNLQKRFLEPKQTLFPFWRLNLIEHQVPPKTPWGLHPAVSAAAERLLQVALQVVP